MKSDDEDDLVFTADRSTGRAGFDTNYTQRCVNMWSISVGLCLETGQNEIRPLSTFVIS
jgi:hypothetical protein